MTRSRRKRIRQAKRSREYREAERAMTRNKALIEAGETFAAHKPSDWRVGGRRREGNV